MTSRLGSEGVEPTFKFVKLVILEVTKFGALLNTKERSLKVDVGISCRTTINLVLCGLLSFLCSLALLLLVYFFVW